MKRIWYFVLLLFLAGCHSGCKAPASPAYDPDAFACTLAVDSIRTGEEGFFTVRYVRDAGTTTMTLTAPATLAGITFTFAGEDCVLAVSECTIPLSRAVSASLQELAALLAADPADVQDIRSADGGTVYLFPAGELTLDETGLPIGLRTNTGRQATVLPAP